MPRVLLATALSILLSGGWSVPVRAAPATVRLTRLAARLEFSPGVGQESGHPYELLLGVESFFTLPGFMRLWPDNQGSYLGQSYRLTAVEFPQTEDMYLGIPDLPDADGDGAPGFLQVGVAVPPTSANGSFEDAWQLPGSVVIQWQRSAGQEVGECRLVLHVFRGRYDEVPFSGTFRIRQLQGSLDYRRPSAGPLEAAVRLTNPAVPSPPYLGRLNLVAVDRDHLRLEPGSFAAPADMGGEQALDEPVLLTRNGATYRGYAYLRRARDPVDRLYRLPWRVAINDPNDSDADGIPDLSDEPGAAGRLTAAWDRAAGAVRLRVDGIAGSRWRVESASDPVTGPWRTDREIELVDDHASWPVDPEAPRFWRLQPP